MVAVVMAAVCVSVLAADILSYRARTTCAVDMIRLHGIT
jgi:hypothetical protein